MHSGAMLCLKNLAAWVVIAAAPAASQTPSVTKQRVDMIELNHYIDEEGREVFQQLIFYDWSKSHKRFHVRAWRLVKHPNQLPHRRWKPSMYHCSWVDDGKIREVAAPSMRETWTQTDPERANRQLLPESQRVPLWSTTSGENGQ